MRKYLDVSYINCRTEQQFKMQYIRSLHTTAETSIFCIETEETEPGFPDAMALINNKATFAEFKFSDKNGTIKFQPTQPSFYKRHPDMLIAVIAYDRVKHEVHQFPVQALFDAESPYYIGNKNTINLSKIRE